MSRVSENQRALHSHERVLEVSRNAHWVLHYNNKCAIPEQQELRLTQPEELACQLRSQFLPKTCQ